MHARWRWNALQCRTSLANCGRYTDTKRTKTLLASAGYEAVQADLVFAPRYTIAPTQEGSIVCLGEDGTPQHKRARWGLCPSGRKVRPSWHPFHAKSSRLARSSLAG